MYFLKYNGKVVARIEVPKSWDGVINGFRSAMLRHQTKYHTEIGRFIGNYTVYEDDKELGWFQENWEMDFFQRMKEPKHSNELYQFIHKDFSILDYVKKINSSLKVP